MGYEFSADEILEMAERIEKNGAEFYRKAAKGVDEPSSKKLLIGVAEMEDEHEKTFATLRRELSEKERVSTVFDPEGETALYLRSVADTHVFFKKDIDPHRLEPGINAIIFWGSISAILGIFAHFSGIYQAMVAISMANDISPAIVAMGYAISLITILTGLLIFMISAVIWFFYRWRYRNIISMRQVMS